MQSNGFIYFQNSKKEMLEINTFKTLSKHYFQPRIQTQVKLSTEFEDKTKTRKVQKNLPTSHFFVRHNIMVCSNNLQLVDQDR